MPQKPNIIGKEEENENYLEEIEVDEEFQKELDELVPIFDAIS